MYLLALCFSIVFFVSMCQLSLIFSKQLLLVAAY
jgi:hypothetical protein